MAKIKQISKNKNKNNNNNVFMDNEMIKLLKILLIVCAVLVIFYLVTVLVNKKDDEIIADGNVSATIQYNKILVGQILNRDENDYYVLVEKENDQYIDLYNYYLSNYDGENKNFKYYNVDLSDVFNGNHVGEKNVITKNVSEFKFATTTLLRVKKGKVIESYHERDEIISYLEKLK